MTVTTLNQLMAANADADRGVTFHAGEGQSRRITYAQLRRRYCLKKH
jgi:hypothetical protein